MNTAQPDIGYGVVLGAPRSGTTFLMRFLDTMPRTEAVSGNLLPTVIPHLVNQDLPEIVRDGLTKGFQRALDDYLESGAFNARAPALRKFFLTRTGLLDALRGGRKIDRIIYKEPFLAFAPEYTYRALPDGRIIYLVRDGRDVADSLVRSYDVLSDEKLAKVTTEAPLRREWKNRLVPTWVDAGREDEFLAASPYARAAWMWTAMVSRCRAYFTQASIVDEGRVLSIHYEHLIRDPRLWGSRVTAHLGASMTRRMYKQIESARDSSIGIHKRRSPKELEEAERIAGQELREHNYL